MTDAIQLDALELETRPDPDATVIWLHGLGAHGSDFIDAVPELGLPASAALRFVFPHAPVIPVTCNGGYRMRAWYDILALDASGRRLDADGLFENRAALRALIAMEKEEHERHAAWLAAIREGAFSFGKAKERYAAAGEGSWKHIALGSTEEEDRYPRGAHFPTSDWKMFHDALQEHRFDVLHSVLPQFGLFED